MESNFLLIVPMIVPVLAGFCVRFLRDEKKQNYVTIFALCVTCLVLFLLPQISLKEMTLWDMVEHLPIFYFVDGMAYFFAVFVAIIWLLVGIYATLYMQHEEMQGEFYFSYLLTLGTMMSLSFSGNLITMYFSYEMMTLATFPLVIHSRNKKAMRAGLKYIGYSMFGAGLGLFGFFFLTTNGIPMDFIAGGVGDAIFTNDHQQPLLVVCFLMILGFGGKAGVFPLHSWLPSAHPVAPSPASAVLSSIITKAGVFCVIRITYYIFGAKFLEGTWVQFAYIALAIVTIFMGSMLAYREKSVKKRFAYSTVSQVSYILLGLMMLTPDGFLGAMLHIVMHGIGKSILFLTAGVVLYETGYTQISQYVGLGRKMPMTFFAFTIATLSMVGIPPLGGFLSKWYLAQGTLSSMLGEFGIFPILLLLFSALVTAGYLFSIVYVAYFNEKEDAIEEERVLSDPGHAMTMPMVVFAVLLLVFGIMPYGLLQVFTGIGSHLF
ncbi:MAG: proton-conducting transporter membrane subunit [Bacillota bacterium]